MKEKRKRKKAREGTEGKELREGARNNKDMKEKGMKEGGRARKREEMRL